ncbi:ATP synthase F1 subunit epsilon [bacterium]|jgi:F-type H+-transporting ATPase subunit epsilon|nr:ATP synthase F1 subunit epsilon [bacterium]
MALTFPLEIVTPLGLVFEGEVEHVRAPGALGSFGILANHTPFITPMTEGEIIVRSAGGEQTYLTSGGLADVSGGKVLILAEDARDPNAEEDEEES